MEEKNPSENGFRNCFNMAAMAAIFTFGFRSIQGNACTDQFEIHRVDWAHEREEPY